MQLHGSNQLRAESEMLMFDTVPTLHRAAWFIFFARKAAHKKMPPQLNSRRPLWTQIGRNPDVNVHIQRALARCGLPEDLPHEGGQAEG
jgi:hypothetical protein